MRQLRCLRQLRGSKLGWLLAALLTAALLVSGCSDPQTDAPAVPSAKSQIDKARAAADAANAVAARTNQLGGESTESDETDDDSR